MRKYIYLDKAFCHYFDLKIRICEISTNPRQNVTTSLHLDCNFP